jgi:hypothetical protein
VPPAGRFQYGAVTTSVEPGTAALLCKAVFVDGRFWHGCPQRPPPRPRRASDPSRRRGPAHIQPERLPTDDRTRPTWAPNNGTERCLILNVRDNVINHQQQLAFTDFEQMWRET